MTTPSTPPRFIDRLPSALRKQFPMCTGFVDYFPDAMAAVSHVSWVGNEKHNKGQPLHHARGKSMDHADCDVRHQSTRHDVDPAYADDVIADVFHLAEHAWRAMAQLQETMEHVYALGLAPAARPAHVTAQGSAVVDAYAEQVAERTRLDAEPLRCDAVDPHSPGARCALVMGHDGPHRGPVVVDHTCAIGKPDECAACIAELGAAGAGGTSVDDERPDPSGPTPERADGPAGFDPAD